jgi:RecG-like helicase
MTPESLIVETFRLTPAQKSALARLNLHTVLELLYYFPTRYSSISEIRNISELVIGEKAIIYGKISNLKTA